MSSISSINVLRPAVFDTAVDAFFTLKNEEYRIEDNGISGFNLGYNTNEASTVIKQNRKVLQQYTHGESRNVVYAKQVHANNVEVVTSAGTYDHTDALVTQIPGLALAIQVADCAAVLIAAPEAGLVAAVHAGWRGAVGNIIPKTLKILQQKGANISSAQAFVSPCIGVDQFEVGVEVANQFPAKFVDSESYPKPHVNLKAFIEHQLLTGGLRNTNIEVSSGCTVRDTHKFYSYRREQKRSGRMMAVIQCKEDNRQEIG